MSIRLSKAIRELNIGRQTAVEFLVKRGDLGEVKDDLNFKLSDTQYNALVEAFKSDKEVRNQAEKLLMKAPKEKKRPAEQKVEKAEPTVETVRVQQFKPVGKIDLDQVGKKPAKPAPQPEKQEKKAEKPVVEKPKEQPKKEEVKPVVQQPKPAVVKPEPAPKAVEQPKKE